MLFEINFYEVLFYFILNIVKTFGLFGIFILSFLEALFAPLPSEIVLPFAGYLAYKENNFYFLFFSIIAGALGNTFGSFPLYILGFFGRRFVEKYGKYFFVSKKKLKIAEIWFIKNKWLTVFVFRCVPGFRSLISIPAGIFKMDLKTYFVLTFFGFLIWNSFLVSLGFLFGEEWEKSLKYSREVEIISAILVLALLIYFIGKHLLI